MQFIHIILSNKKMFFEIFELCIFYIFCTFYIFVYFILIHIYIYTRTRVGPCESYTSRIHAAAAARIRDGCGFCERLCERLCERHCERHCRRHCERLCDRHCGRLCNESINTYINECINEYINIRFEKYTKYTNYK